MHITKIGIFKIAQTRVNWGHVEAWLDFLGVKAPMEVIGQIAAPSVAAYFDPQLDGTQTAGTDASALIALCGKRCYNSFEVGLNPNISKIRTDHAEYITNILKSGHGSVLEHATWSFAIENISRVFTAEMNRHRAGVAISEASMRYIRFDNVGFTMPDSIIETEEDLIQKAQHEESSWFGETEYGPKEETRELFEEAFDQMQQWHIDLCNIWKIGEMKNFAEKKRLTSMFRRLMGMGVSTGGVWTINARALRHIITMRGNWTNAEEEIYHVFDSIATMMIEDEPLLFGDFTKNTEGSWVPKYSKV